MTGLWPPPPSPRWLNMWLCLWEAVWFSKTATLDCLKSGAESEKKGKRPSHGVYFDVPPLPACSWNKICLPRGLWIHPASPILGKHSIIGQQAAIKLDVGVRTCVLIYETCGIVKYEYGWYQVTYRFPRRLHILVEPLLSWTAFNQLSERFSITAILANV